LKGECNIESLGFVGDPSNLPGYPLKNKLSNAGGVSTVFVNYTIFVPFLGTTASVNLAAIVTPECAPSGGGNWEFQGLLQLVPSVTAARSIRSGGAAKRPLIVSAAPRHGAEPLSLRSELLSVRRKKISIVPTNAER